MTAMDDWEVGDLEQVVRRAAPFAGLTRPVLEAVLDMLAGRYPSEEFAGAAAPAGLGPHHRHAARPARRPAAGRDQRRHHPRPRPVRRVPGRVAARPTAGNSHRVGELDEEMVYESRVGDVFVLGASSWRIEDITADQVLVSPAPGQPGRLPFWHGDAPGPARPSWAGRSARTAASWPRPAEQDGHRAAARRRPGRAGRGEPGPLPGRAAGGHRVRARRPHAGAWSGSGTSWATGGWCCTARSARRCTRPWALAIAARLRERYQGMDVQAMHTDDGIVIRVPDTDEPPPAGIAELRPGGGRAAGHRRAGQLGAVRVPVPRVRGPRAAAAPAPAGPPHARCGSSGSAPPSCSSVARKYGTFPIVLETVRECLQDVFDVPGLIGLMRDLASRQDPAGRGGDRRPRPRSAGRCCSATSARSCTRATRRSPSAGPRRWPWTRRCWPSCSARPTCASCSTRRWSSETERELQRLPPEPGLPGRRRRGRPAARHRAAVRGRGGGAVPGPGGRARAGWPSWPAQRRALRGPGRRRGPLGRHRGRRAAAGRARACRCRPACRPRSPSRCPTRSATWSPGTPAAHGPFTTADVAARYGLGRGGGHRRRCAGWPPRAGSPRASSCPGGAAPQWCDTGGAAHCCAAAAWPSCARRPSRCPPRRWPGSCPPGRTRPARTGGPRQPGSRAGGAGGPGRRVRGHRPAGRGGGARLGAGDADPARPGARLPARHAGRADRRRARSSGPARAGCPAATAGWCWRPPTPRRCCCPRPARSP